MYRKGGLNGSSEGQHYRIKREVRDLIVFAQHSLLRDPPFSHIDLISCRNLLIYRGRELQSQASGTSHYALRSGDISFLDPLSRSTPKVCSASLTGMPAYFIAAEPSRPAAAAEHVV